MAEVVALGEAMIRLTPPGATRLEQARTLDLDVGGAELNALVGLSRLGVGTAWLSKLPDNPLGRSIAARARAEGVDVGPVIWTAAGRAGLYFVEAGAAPRAGQVIYDRRDSAMSRLRADELDPARFAGARVFHVSGITPALGPGCLEATLAAVALARAAGCAVSFDPNYRARLWSVGEARAAYARLIPAVDILFATREALATFFAIDEPDDEAAARAALGRLGLRAVALTSRDQAHAFRGTIGALAAAGGQVYRARDYDLEIVDRLGAGDAFAAGFLHGFLHDDPERGVAWGQALAALQHTIPGDFPLFTRAEVEELVASGGGGTLRLRR
jgi:2-dehydro-3-deoxygluconokinase